VINHTAKIRPYISLKKRIAGAGPFVTRSRIRVDRSAF